MKYRRYAEYKESGVEWLGEVPAHWGVSVVKRHFAVELGKMFDQAKQNGSGTRKPYLRAANIHWDRLKLDDINEMEFSDGQMERYRLEPGDLLVTEGGVTVGRSALWHGELDECYYQNSLNRVRPLESSAISTRYLLYWMDFTTNAGYVDLVADKATFGHLTNEKLTAFPLVAPRDKEEVAAIITFLDCETAQIDALIAKQERLIAVLQEKRQALISHAVTKGLNPDAPMKDSGVEWLGKVPAHWNVRKLKSLTTQAVAGPYGSSLTKAMYTDEGYRVYGQQQVISDCFEVGDYYIPEIKYREMTQYRVFPGDVLVSVMGTIGRVAVVPENVAPGIINPRLVRYRPDFAQINPRFLQIALQSDSSQSQLAQFAKGTTMDGLNMQSLGSVNIVVPPLGEQDRILDQLSWEKDKISATLASAEHGVALLQERRAALISAAVTGKIDVQE